MISNLYKKILNHLLNSKISVILPDSIYLKLKFKIKIGYRLNLKHPKSFNEKIQWLKLYDRNPKYTKLVDKYLVKEYVASIIGNEYVIPTLGVYEKFDDIDFNKLPNRFVIKCTHDSGGVVICKDKEHFNMKEAKKKINKHLKQNYYFHGREWPYKNVHPRIIIEEFIGDVNEDILDYKLMCFNGKVKCSFVCSERRSDKGLAVDFYDINWNHMPFTRHYRNSEYPLKKPFNYEKMIEISEALSKDIHFVRIDFYEINNQLYFGEFTFYPGCGFEEFEPVQYDYILGEYLKLPIDKRSDLYNE